MYIAGFGVLAPRLSRQLDVLSRYRDGEFPALSQLQERALWGRLVTDMGSAFDCGLQSSCIQGHATAFSRKGRISRETPGHEVRLAKEG